MGAIRRGRPRKLNLATAKGAKPPAEAGVYRFVKRDTRQILYVGEAGKLHRRFQEHLRTGKFDPSVHDFWWSPADEQATTPERRQTEKEWIKRHSPPLNRNGGGGGRHARLPLVHPPVNSAPPDELAPESAPEPASESMWQRMGRSFTAHIREKLVTLGNEMKDALVAQAKVKLQAWAEDQKTQLIDRVKRRFRR